MSLCLEFQSADELAELGEDFDPPYPIVNFLIEFFDNVAVTFFVVEYIIRIICCPRKIKFFFA